MVENGEEKKFVIKHVFENISQRITSNVVYGNEEEHYGILWKLGILSWRILQGYNHFIGLEFRKSEVVEESEWSMEIEVDSIFYKESTNNINKTHFISGTSNAVIGLVYIHDSILEKYLFNGNLEAEFHVEIKKMTGFKLPKLRIFDDDVAKKFSDVCLMAGNQKFYVNKMFMASHSSYFESLFSGNFSESQKSIIELKDIDLEDFQKFLEVLYGEPAIDNDTVEGILKLADMYDARTASKRCEKFLFEKSKNSIKIKFTLAVRYKLDALKEKCLSELKTTAEIRELVPEKADDFDPFVWKELFLKATSPQ
ncbi:hypothetical protein B9Z55_007932 [Caenorhabditis nigoni]|uniref:BTB domain-containing protein n=1 Tax=Caenorhabditis nigoni TaxID=1611254 RepID=A0A2G5VBZ0_9PELO|nr:hypothetical protein B9Z55_007932 [Caenorhabditis nigoni]